MVQGTAEANYDDVPLPADLKVVPPDPNLPQEYAKFSGKWYGIWDSNILKHVLVVEEIDQAGARVVYAWGTAPAWWIDQPGWVRVKGQFTKGSLVIETQRATVTYRMHEDGTLCATYKPTRTLGYYTATLSRVE